jgi:hypothetical protein
MEETCLRDVDVDGRDSLRDVDADGRDLFERPGRGLKRPV